MNDLKTGDNDQRIRLNLLLCGNHQRMGKKQSPLDRAHQETAFVIARFDASQYRLVR